MGTVFLELRCFNMSGYRSLEYLKRLYKSSNDADAMPLLNDCSDGCYLSKELPPPMYIGVTGYCKKDIDNAEDCNPADEQISGSVSAPTVVELPGSSHVIADQQPAERYSRNENECSNDRSFRLNSSRSSTSSGFGSSNERECEVEFVESASCATTTRSGFFKSSSSSSTASSNPSSLTHIEETIRHSTASQRITGSHLETGPDRKSTTPPASGSTSYSSIYRSSNSSSVTREKAVVGDSLSTIQSVESHSGSSNSTSYLFHKTQTSSNASSTMLTLSLPSDFDIDRYDGNDFANSRDCSNTTSVTRRPSGISVGSQSGRMINETPAQNKDDAILVRSGERCDRNVDIIIGTNNESAEMLPLLSVPGDQKNPTEFQVSERNTQTLYQVSAFQENIDIDPDTLDRYESSIEGTETILITVYKEEKPTKISFDVPKIVKRSRTTGNTYSAYDPTIIMDMATDLCNVHYYYKPMFGLWRNSSNQWIIMTELLRSTQNLELRVRFTVPIKLSGHPERNNADQSDETPSSFPPMNTDLLRYFFNQRRHQFRQSFPNPKDTEVDKFLEHLLPGSLETNDGDNDYDPVLYLAVFDELRKRVEYNCTNIMSKRCLAKKLGDILPKSMYEEFKTPRWYNLSKQLELKIIWERFHHLLGIACDQLNGIKKECLYIAYINHVEKVLPSVMSEVVLLENEMAAICINGERGIVFATELLSALGLEDFESNSKCSDGLRLKTCGVMNILELNFSDIADIQTSSTQGKILFITDFLGNELILPFTTNEDKVRFVESVNQYYRLLVDQTRQFPCLRKSRIKEKVYVHECIRERYLVDVLEKHSSRFSCLYRKSPQDNKLDVYIKTIQDEESVIQRSSITKNAHGHFTFTECNDIAIEASCAEDFIEDIVTKIQRGHLGEVLGKDNCKALVHVIKPSAVAPSALLKRRVPTRQRERKEMEQLRDDQFGAVMDVFTGEFTMSMITKFSGNRYTLLTRNFITRERRQDIANELEEVMDVLYAVRHHRHIVRQIGVGVAFDWKVLEYSKWGNLSTYFERRAIRGAEAQDDVMVMTGHFLIQIFRQLALALNYLATKNLAHGAIRAENILIFQISPTPFIKLSHPGVRGCQISHNLYDKLKKTLRCTSESRIPTLARPWLAKELLDNLDTADCTSSLEGDIWAYATTVAEIIIYANTGRSFEHSWSCLDACNRHKVEAKTHWEKIYYASNDSCDIATIPDWLNHPRVSGEKFGHKLRRCWKTAPVLRPSIHQLLQSISVLVHSDVGKDIEIYPSKPDTPSNDRMIFQEEIQSFSDLDLVYVRELSSGHFGTVDLYKQLSAKREYAVKDIKNFDHESMKRFIEELRTALRLRHENIVKIEGMTVPSQRIVMEFISGGSLESKFKMNPYFCQRQLISFALDIAMGLQELHRMSILHRDLAARNILLKPKKNDKKEYIAVISDFGLSRVVQDQYYSTEEVFSFPFLWYPPGEEFRHASRGTDIWSYGVTVWEMFKKCRPPKVAPLMEKPKFCPTEIYNDILWKCWKKKPRDRIELHEIISILIAVGQNYGDRSVEKSL